MCVAAVNTVLSVVHDARADARWILGQTSQQSSSFDCFVRIPLDEKPHTEAFVSVVCSSKAA